MFLLLTSSHLDHHLAREADLALEVIVLVVLPFPSARTTLAVQVIAHNHDEAVDVLTPGPIHGRGRGPIPVPDTREGTLDQGAVLTHLTPGGKEGDTIEADPEADLQCPTERGTREIG